MLLWQCRLRRARLVDVAAVVFRLLLAVRGKSVGEEELKTTMAPLDHMGETSRYDSTCFVTMT